MKTFVLTVSKQFPKTHIRAGESTRFVENIKRLFISDCDKIHTIRANYELWEKRAKEINEGKAILSIRYWSDKPYNSKQVEICRLEKIGIEKLEDPTNFVFATIGDKQVNWESIAINDGLSFEDFCEWFKVRSKKPMAIIHFTNFRYCVHAVNGSASGLLKQLEKAHLKLDGLQGAMASMELSHNVLVIESLSTIPEHSDNIVRIKGEMNATIKFHCSVNGNHFRSLTIKSEGKAYSDIDALKQAIQNFLNGDFYSENRYYDREIESFACNKIHHIDIQVGEPFKSLFEQIFDMSNWEIPKRELPMGDVS